MSRGKTLMKEQGRRRGETRENPRGKRRERNNQDDGHDVDKDVQAGVGIVPGHCQKEKRFETEGGGKPRGR